MGTIKRKYQYSHLDFLLFSRFQNTYAYMPVCIYMCVHMHIYKYLCMYTNIDISYIKHMYHIIFIYA